MAKFCFDEQQPVDEYQIVLGFLIFVGFFGLMCYCQKSSEQRMRLEQKNKQRKSKPSNIVTYNFREMKKKQAQREQYRNYTFNYDETQMDLQKSQQLDDEPFQAQDEILQMIIQKQLSPIRKRKTKAMSETMKRLSSYAYDYANNEHLITHQYRKPQEIRKEIQEEISRVQKKPEPKKKQQIPVQNNEPKSGIKKAESQSNLKNIVPKKEGQTKPKEPENTIPTLKIPSLKQTTPMFTSLTDPTKSTSPLPKIDEKKAQDKGFSLFPNLNQKQPQGLEDKKVSPAPTAPIQTNKQTNNQTSNQTSMPLPTNKEPQQSQQPQPSQPTSKEPNKPGQQKQSLFPPLPTTNQPKPPTKQPEITSKPPTTAPTAKIDTSMDYLNAIRKYSQDFTLKTQISTNISNLSGARSDPRQLWLFASSYIKTINPNNHDEVVTFSYKIWDAVVNKFIKNTNIKDGFEKMPPKERNKQVEKNSINTYVLLVNIFRVMGFQAVWLGVFGKTLDMLNFIFTRKEPIVKWDELQLYKMKYIIPDGDISSKYQSRIDFLTYFLLTLTTMDPIQAFEEISQKTNQPYPFIDELKRYKHKWSYRQFWCLIDSMKKNPIQAYFKIPFWTNALASIYLQTLRNLKHKDMKQFELVSQIIIKEIKQHTKKFDDSQEAKKLQDQAYQNKAKGYQFDGDEFINGIKTLGRGIDIREREMRLASRRWQDYRDKFSILYYFWRKDTF